jgi:Chemoreceptor zinc-binding domain
MAFLDWLGGKDVSDKSAESKTVPVEESLSGLNLQQVLGAHTAWKARLQHVLDGTSDEAFEIEVVSQDCNCFLGKWIYSEGKKQFGHLPEFEAVRSAHADFHVSAGDVLLQHQMGNVEHAAELLKTKFRTASNKNQMELTRLFMVAKTKQ